MFKNKHKYIKLKNIEEINNNITYKFKNKYKTTYNKTKFEEEVRKYLSKDKWGMDEDIIYIEKPNKKTLVTIILTPEKIINKKFLEKNNTWSIFKNNNIKIYVNEINWKQGQSDIKNIDDYRSFIRYSITNTLKKYF